MRGSGWEIFLKMKTKNMKWNDLDLKIPLSHSQAGHLKLALEKFRREKRYQFCEPKIDNGVLRINSSDLINFLDRVECLNEFDHFRLKALAMKAISKVGSRKKDPLLVQHYRRCEEIVRDLKLRERNEICI